MVGRPEAHIPWSRRLTEYMRPSGLAKRLALRLGVYPLARAIQRHLLDRDSLRRFQNEVAFFRALLPPGSLCFDVGANTGEKSEALIATGAQVVSFEPNPAVWDELNARCAKFAQWKFVPVALGSAGGFMDLYARTRSTCSSLSSDWLGEVERTYHVPVLTLDAAIAHFDVPHYCKIDVEGWELEVLRGLSEPISLLSFEYHTNDRGIDSARSCLRMLRELADCEANLIGPEQPVLRLAEWVSLPEFLKWFPGSGHDGAPGPYGDVFVRRVGQ